MAIQITDSNFHNTVLETSQVVMIDFWAEWCGPCRAIAPVVEQLSKEYSDRAVIGKVDVDSNPNVSHQYGIRSIPTILFIKDGKVVDKQVGAVPKSILEAKLKNLL